MQETEFMKRLRAAQREVVNAAIGELQAATTEAVKTLRRNLNCGIAFAENSAATTILTQSFKVIEMQELAERVERLEQLLEQKEGKRQWR
jgi:16S rRNA C1402 (ribose-2'-O) methylase RsmI